MTDDEAYKLRSEHPNDPVHPRHLAVIVKVGRERRPTGTTEFGGHLVLHESDKGFHADLENIRKAGHSLIDGLIAKLRAEGWGAAKNGPKAWDEKGPIDPHGD